MVPIADAPANETIFSFVVDEDPRFAYEGWHLARSLVEHCGGETAAIHVQCTPGVSEAYRAIFRDQGYVVHQIERFGDGRYCNKIAQLANLQGVAYDRVVLLDTDTIVVSDLRPFLTDTAVMGKIVDVARPPLATLIEIAAAAGMGSLPPVCATDAGNEETFSGNCNGGFYAIPRRYSEALSREWRRWALWLLDNIEPLRRVRREQHVDQVSFWLAIHCGGFPFVAAPSNVNYFTHFTATHGYFDEEHPIAMLHYHGTGLNVIGLLEPGAELASDARAAVDRANRQIARGFESRLFWDLRYRHFPERGSGVGSRGDNAAYKRSLLRAEGAEAARSVLDVGCGDLEVVKDLDLHGYVGLDQSVVSLELARLARPEWVFRNGLPPDVPSADMVLCFEVLIHQETLAAYRALLAYLAAKTARTLLVSGFDSDPDPRRTHPMVFFYEPLGESLGRLAGFRTMELIGRHSGVVVYRCDK
jgi:hypothetical protein